MNNLIKRITGTNANKPTIIVEFYEDGISLLCLEGTKPFIRKGLTFEDAKTIIENANYSINIENFT